MFTARYEMAFKSDSYSFVFTRLNFSAVWPIRKPSHAANCAL